MSVTINGTNGLTFNDNTTQATSPFAGGLGFRNRIINPGMVIDQRNNGASVTVAGTVSYSLDRWGLTYSSDSKLSFQRNAGSVTPPSGFTNYLGFTSLSAYSLSASDYFATYQTIEGFNIADLGWGTSNAQPVTLSFRVYSSLTGTFGGVLKNASVGATRSYPFTYSVPSANTWTTITLSVTGDTAGTWNTNNTAGLCVQFGLGVGSTFSGPAGAWASANYLGATGSVSVVSTNGATFYITGVQLEKGSTATEFDRRPYGTELALCQRYLNAYGGDGINDILGFGTMYSTTQGLVGVSFPVTMRATPTLSVSNVSHWRAELSGVGNTVCSALSLDSISNSKVVAVAATFGANASGGSNKCFCIIQNATTSARMFFSAEL